MDVLLYERVSQITQWSQQFVDHDPGNRRRIAVAPNTGPNELVRIVRRAACSTGNGRLVFATGHGAVGPQGGAMVDLAPLGHFQIRRSQPGAGDSRPPHPSWAYALAFYDVGVNGAQPQRQSDQLVIANARHIPALRSGVATARHSQQMRQYYDDVGSALRDGNVREVVFLACSVGNDMAFISRIAQDWGPSITAFRRRVVFSDTEDHGLFVRCYLEGETPGTGNNTPTTGRTETPTGSDVVTASASYVFSTIGA